MSTGLHLRRYGVVRAYALRSVHSDLCGAVVPRRTAATAVGACLEGGLIGTKVPGCAFVGEGVVDGDIRGGVDRLSEEAHRRIRRGVAPACVNLYIHEQSTLDERTVTPPLHTRIRQHESFARCAQGSALTFQSHGCTLVGSLHW